MVDYRINAQNNISSVESLHIFIDFNQVVILIELSGNILFEEQK